MSVNIKQNSSSVTAQLIIRLILQTPTVDMIYFEIVF